MPQLKQANNRKECVRMNSAWGKFQILGRKKEGGEDNYSDNQAVNRGRRKNEGVRSS